MINRHPNSQHALLKPKELWNNFRQGDKNAFEYIYRMHIQSLFNYGVKITPNQECVRDCIQELFVELWNGKKNLSETDNIKFYLFKALKIKINHILKKESSFKLKVLEPLFMAGFVESFEQSVIDTQQSEEKKRRLLKAIDQLPQRQKEALTLLFFEELSYEEIASLMSLNISSAYTLVWKALSALRKHFKKYITIIFLLIQYKAETW